MLLPSVYFLVENQAISGYVQFYILLWKVYLEYDFGNIQINRERETNHQFNPRLVCYVQEPRHSPSTERRKRNIHKNMIN